VSAKERKTEAVGGKGKVCGTFTCRNSIRIRKTMNNSAGGMKAENEILHFLSTFAFLSGSSLKKAIKQMLQLLLIQFQALGSTFT